jgi:DHA1 family tetracycline resistance protein-like MFS transporter
VKGARKPALAFILVTVFLDVLGFGLVIPVLPSLIAQFTSVREVEAQWYGVLGATYGLMQFFAAPTLGALSDRFGRRPVLLISMAGLGLDFLVLAFAPSLWVMLAARVIGGITGASFSVASAYVADISTPEKRAMGFGLIGAAFGLGFIFGPVIGGLLGNLDVHWPFFAAAGLAGLNVLNGLFVLPESLPPLRRAPLVWKNTNPLSAIGQLARLRGAGVLVLVIALSGLAQFILRTSWVLFTTFRFDWTPRDNGLALFAVGIVAVVVQGGLLRPILKRYGETRTVVLGLGTGAIAYLCYGLALSGWVFYIIIVASFLSYASGPALQAIVSKVADPDAQGVAMGALNSLSSITGVVAPVIGGLLLAAVASLPKDDWRIGAVFYVCAALQGLALLCAIWHFRVRAPLAAPAASITNHS